MELNIKNVDFIQSAVNPIAVSRQFAEWVKEVARAEGMTAARQNDLLRGVLGKLCDMFSLEHGDSAYEYMASRKDQGEA
jgi:hypothetical protein